MDEKDILYVVVPCYNEEAVLPETTRQFKNKMTTLIETGRISSQSKVMYVNDGSKDKTWEMIKSISEEDSLFTGISLSRNRGHQNALLAGLMTAKEYANVVISMDADLQDDINAIDEMLDKYGAGADIVYAVRKNRKKDSFFKKWTAETFYKFMQKMGVNIVYNHADYRLTSKRVLDSLEEFKEVNLFLRGMFPLIGFRTDIVYYERKERNAGESKYPLKKMLHFAWDGITSFSVQPIKMVRNFGVLLLTCSIIFFLYLVINSIIENSFKIQEYILASIWFVAGIQTLSLGIIGEYVGKVYGEVKRRPRFIIQENLLVDGDKTNER